MSEVPTSHPHNREAEIQEGLAQLAETLDYAATLPEDDASRATLHKAMFEMIDGHVQNDPYYSGGQTIPGTDEWIPGERHDRYSYVDEGTETGQRYSVPLPTAFGRRLEAFARLHRPDVSEVPPAEAASPAAGQTEDATVLPFERPKRPSSSTEVTPVDIELPAHLTVTVRQRGGAHRPQGAPGQLSGERQGVLGGAFDTVEEHTTKNGVKRLYAVDHDGKMHQIKYDAILEAYGHAGERQGKRPLAEAIVDVDEPGDEAAAPAGRTAEAGTAAAESTAPAVEAAEVAAIIDASEAATTPAARQGLKQRLLRRLKQAGRQLYLAPQNLQELPRKAFDYLNDKDKGRRRGITAGVIGVAAVGAAFVATKYGSDLFSHASHAHTGTAAPNKDLLDALSGKGSGSGAGAHAHEIHLTLHHGDTIWNDIADTAAKHGHHYSDEHIRQLTEQTLRANGLSWEDARHLPTGYHFDIPREVQEQLAKKAA